MSRILGFMLLCLLPAFAWAADGGTYTIEVNKGTLIRMNGAATAVIVADPTIADVQVVSPRMVYLNGRKVGETTILAVGENDQELLHAQVNVTHNLSRLNATVRELMPDSDVGFESVDGALVMKGNVRSPIEAENVKSLATPFLQDKQTLINMIKTDGSNQVTLMVRVAEVSRNELKRFGINLESLLSSGNFLFGLARGNDIAFGANGSVLRSSNGADNLFGSYKSGSANITGLLDALENEGLVTMLAEPNLTAMSGQTANFLAGGEFPIPVPGQNGQVTIDYRSFGVSLGFTPTVLSKDRISLTVAPEVSSLSQTGAVQLQGFSVPALVTRRASTTVELGSGQTFAIAGLLQKDITNTIDKFPGLGDVPILGSLFRSSDFRNNQSELVILVTPYVVNGVSGKMAAPTDGFQPPSDLERILFGKMYHETPTATGEPSAAAIPGHRAHLRGAAGYMMP